MKYLNGFFQLDIRNDGIYAHIYPKNDGGRDIVIQEFAEYLEKCKIREYNLPQIHKEICDVKQETDIFISSQKIDEIDEMVKIRVTDDRMNAVIRFYPPSKNGKFMTEQDILNELKNENISYGILNKFVKAYLNGRQFCRDIPIAKGKPVMQGENSKIIYHFDTEPTSKPKLLEDGSVDFHELNIFTGVKQGDLLAELIPSKLGENGIDIYGNEIPPLKVKNHVLKYGRNIQISEDKSKIYSNVDGDVRLEDDTVFVSNTYYVSADVDNSTGDIKYDGNVFVTGNVRSGFKIEATGDVEVNGVMEGASIIAGGNIVIKRGVQGMGKGYLEAGNNIVTKFIESCNVKANHTVNTGSSLHSDIEAGEVVIVSGRKGFLIGGNISAGKRIEASVFGNKMNTQTNLKVGVDPLILEKFKELTILLKEENEDLLKHRQILESFKKKLAEGQKVLPNQMVIVKQSSEEFKDLTSKIEKETDEYKMLKTEIDNNKSGKVVVNYTIYPGVSIFISNRVYHVKDMRSRCQFRLDGADVVTMPI